MSSCLPCVVVVPVFIPWDTRAIKSLEHKSSPNTHIYHTHERERAVIRKESIQVTKLCVTRCNTPRRQTLSPQSLSSQPAPYRHGHVSHLTAKWILWSPIYHLVELWPPKHLNLQSPYQPKTHLTNQVPPKGSSVLSPAHSSPGMHSSDTSMKKSSLRFSSLVSPTLLPSQAPGHSCRGASALIHLALPPLCFNPEAQLALPLPQGRLPLVPAFSQGFPQHGNVHLPMG